MEEAPQKITNTPNMVECEELEDKVKKARYEGIIGYVCFLADAIEKGKIKDLCDLRKTLKNDSIAAFWSMAPLISKELQIEGMNFGLMDLHFIDSEPSPEQGKNV